MIKTNKKNKCKLNLMNKVMKNRMIIFSIHLQELLCIREQLMLAIIIHLLKLEILYQC